ncbi:unnamed protein product [Rotaria magnacalcarata]|uniref:Uncharacterized protein n=1 Tax=Rotaria magnacalcarata TaxID=392030 RepID=A0A816QXG7_9BILA|nr:unnamed protein product [Rotaria magnacalcarata]CAF1529528.1 unnamed protein product [Rotaria magnacalcarata]CAF2034345.1 unnamed protein product [Rotaria magnacalcarata]CAF2066798.1 unnamed protein product [Rotaria magnacalcarata]CAF2102184.1 unnamed protein product [Rotaria magnacalcarata]
MRIFVHLVYFLIIILCILQRIIGKDCRCECCTTQNCSPKNIGYRTLWFCSEASSCTPVYCTDWYPENCPPRGSPGQTRAICVSPGHAGRLLPTSCIIIVFVPNSIRRPMPKTDYPLWNTTTITTPYRRPTTAPQIRLDWLEKMGLISKTSTTKMIFYKPRV